MCNRLEMIVDNDHNDDNELVDAILYSNSHTWVYIFREDIFICYDVEVLTPHT